MKNDVIKKEIDKLSKKKDLLDPNDEFKDYTLELLNKLNCQVENDKVIFKNKLGFTFLFDSLNRKAKKEMINKLITSLEISRDKNYNIEITNIKFTDEFISKSSNEYLEYLNDILQDNKIGFIYKEAITKEEQEKLQDEYYIFSSTRIEKEDYSELDLKIYFTLLQEHFYEDGVICYPYIENKSIVDQLILIPKS